MDEQLLEQIESYNAFVMMHIKNIPDFDIWYEMSSGLPFPKDWYTYIKAGEISSHK